MYWENPIHKNIVNPIPIPNTIAQAWFLLKLKENITEIISMIFKWTGNAILLILIIFLPCTEVVYAAFPSRGCSNFWLNIHYLPLVALSAFSNFLVGLLAHQEINNENKKMEESEKRCAVYCGLPLQASYLTVGPSSCQLDFASFARFFSVYWEVTRDALSSLWTLLLIHFTLFLFSHLLQRKQI